VQQIRRLMLAAAGAVLLVACAPGAQGTKADPAADEAAVRAVNGAWFKAYAAGDAAGVAANYAADAVISPPGVPAARGAEAILAFFTQDIAAIKAAGLSFAPDPSTDVGVSGDLGWETGTFKVTAPDGSAVDTGKFSTVFARRDGSWKIIRDTWNSDATTPSEAGKVVRVVRFTAASAESQQVVVKLVDDEIDALYRAAKGFHWVKYYVDPKTLETGSMSLWDSASDVDAFLKSDGYKVIPGKLKPLMKGPMIANVFETHTPPQM